VRPRAESMPSEAGDCDNAAKDIRMSGGTT
jgi:hypothetical protein